MTRKNTINHQTADKVWLVFRMSKVGATLKPNDSGAGVRFGRAEVTDCSICAVFWFIRRHAQKPGWFLSVAPDPRYKYHFQGT